MAFNRSRRVAAEARRCSPALPRCSNTPPAPPLMAWATELCPFTLCVHPGACLAHAACQHCQGGGCPSRVAARGGSRGLPRDPTAPPASPSMAWATELCPLALCVHPGAPCWQLPLAASEPVHAEAAWQLALAKGSAAACAPSLQHVSPATWTSLGAH